jgi:hypothetical protein
MIMLEARTFRKKFFDSVFMLTPTFETPRYFRRTKGENTHNDLFKLSLPRLAVVQFEQKWRRANEVHCVAMVVLHPGLRLGHQRVREDEGAG